MTCGKDYIEVIGGKTAGEQRIPYLRDIAEFDRNYRILRRSVGIPIYAIQAIRNPFDMIAANAVIGQGTDGQKGLKTFVNLKRSINSTSKAALKFNNTRIIDEETSKAFGLFEAAEEIGQKIVGRNYILEIHNCDLVHKPKKTLSKILEFLEVPATKHYLDECAQKVFASESRSRDTVVWTPEQIERIETRMNKYDTLSRYSFTSC